MPVLCCRCRARGVEILSSCRVDAPDLRVRDEQREIDAAEIARNRVEREMLETELQAAKSAAAKDKERETARERALELAEQLASFSELNERRFLVDDATPEKIVDLMARQTAV